MLLYVGGQAVRVDVVIVILRGDFHLACLVVEDGMIAAVMPEFELVGFSAEREAEELVAQANTERAGLCPLQRADMLAVA